MSFYVSVCLSVRPFVRSFFRMYLYICVCVRAYVCACVRAGVHACMYVWLAVSLSRV